MKESVLHILFRRTWRTAPVLLSALLWHAQAAENTRAHWQNDSTWLYGALISRFADSAGDYQTALDAMNAVAENSKQYNAFDYSYALALDSLQYEKAEQLARQWVAGYPQDETARFALIRVLLLRNEQQEAYQEMVNILQQDSSPHSIAQIVRYLTYLEAGADRVQMLAKLSQKFSDNAYIYYYLGIVAREQGEIATALQAFESALKLDVHWVQLERMQAETLAKVGRLSEAREKMHRLQKKHPEDAQLLVAEVNMLIENYQWKEALDIIEKLQKQSVELEDMLRLKARLYVELGEYEQAQATHQELLNTHAIDEPFFNFLNAQAALSAQNFPKAEEWLQKIDIHSRFYLMAQQDRALMQIERKELSKAKETFTHLRERFPDYALELYLIEIARLDQVGAHQEAGAVLGEGLKAFPEQIDMLYAKAEHETVIADYAQAEKTYQQILQIDTANIDALNAYGYLLLVRLNDKARAQALIEQALKRYPDSPAIQDSYAWLLFLQGKAKEALPWAQKAYVVYRKDEVAAHYIEILLACGENRLAQEIYQYEREGQPNNPYLKRLEKQFADQKHS